LGSEERLAFEAQLVDRSNRLNSLHPGKHTGSVRVSSPDTLTVSLTWGDPYGGSGEDGESLLLLGKGVDGWLCGWGLWVQETS